MYKESVEYGEGKGWSIDDDLIALTCVLTFVPFAVWRLAAYDRRDGVRMKVLGQTRYSHVEGQRELMDWLVVLRYGEDEQS